MRELITIIYVTTALWYGCEYTIFGFFIYVPLIIIAGKFDVSAAKKQIIKLTPILELLIIEYNKRGYDSASYQINDFINGTKQVLGAGLKVLPHVLFPGGGSGLDKLGTSLAGLAIEKTGELISDSAKIKSLDREGLKQEINRLRNSISQARNTIDGTDLNYSIILTAMVILGLIQGSAIFEYLEYLVDMLSTSAKVMWYSWWYSW